MIPKLGAISNSLGLNKLTDFTDSGLRNITKAAGKVTATILGNTADDLKAGINRHGSVARTNRFSVIMKTPDYNLFNQNAMSIAYGLSNGYVQSFLDDPRDIGIFCESVSIPSSNLSTFNYSLEKHSQTVVNGFTNSEFSISFIVTNDYFIPRMFKTWEKSIIDRKTNRVKYKNQYARDAFIVCCDDNNIPNYVVKIKGAFPITQSEMNFNETEMNAYVTYSVTFAYDDFEEYSISEMFGDLTDAVSSTLKSVGGFLENLNVPETITSTSLPDFFKAQGNSVGTITSTPLRPI